jgi:hypothetical protein
MGNVLGDIFKQVGGGLGKVFDTANKTIKAARRIRWI